MPPTRRTTDPLAALRAQGDVVVAAVDALPDAAFAAPSRLAGWTTGDLVAHLAHSISATRRWLAGPAADQADGDRLTYYDGVGQYYDGVADLARELAAGRTPDELRARLRAAFSEAVDAATGLPPDCLVAAGVAVVRLDDMLETRLVEAVVHGLDLGVEPDRAALRTVVRLLVGMLAARAPGRTVEVRVPPYAAVQCVPGPRHTRGTPPNVVEADPVPFVELAAGRLAWADAVADGRVRASGSRADLSPYVPLL